jgi:chlorobactene glucosyltransferase
MMKGIFLFVLYQFFNSIINLFLIRKPSQYGDLSYTPKVSVLVPARNEERNINRCLQSLLQQDYPNYEVVVLNDDSEDRTGKILSTINDEKLRVIESVAPVPNGWTGKNWACHRLFLESTGDILIFTDADTFHSSVVVRTMVSEMQRRNISFISGMPREIVMSFGEKITIPFMSYSVVSIFPLFLSYLSPVLGFLSVANGQFMMFERDSYQQIGGHAAVKEEIVEDIALSKRARTYGLKTGVYNLSDLVYCHMYEDFKAAFYGLSKSYFALFSMKVIPSIFVWAWILLVAVYPFATLGNSADRLLSILTIITTSLIWGITTFSYKLPMDVVLYYPLTMIVNSLIGFHSILKGCFGSTSWKGRTINGKKPELF